MQKLIAAVQTALNTEDPDALRACANRLIALADLLAGEQAGEKLRDAEDRCARVRQAAAEAFEARPFPFHATRLREAEPQLDTVARGLLAPLPAARRRPYTAPAVTAHAEPGRLGYIPAGIVTGGGGWWKAWDWALAQCTPA